MTLVFPNTDIFDLMEPLLEDMVTPAVAPQQVARRDVRGQKMIQPKTDIIEQDDKILMKLELPGMDKENVNVNVDEKNHRLTVSGEFASEFHQQEPEGEQEKKEGQQEKQKQVQQKGQRQVCEQGAEKHRHILSERRYGFFQRTFPIPSEVTANDVKADLKDGVLTIEVKKPQKQPEEKKIQVGG